jgi:hypothetical protein
MVNAESSFVRNDGRSPFTVSQDHLFAVQGAKGVVVGKDTPNPDAALSIKGALRIQYNEKKNDQLGTGSKCGKELEGTVKTVEAVYNDGNNNTTQYCPCRCNDKQQRIPLLTTPQCTNACEGREPQKADIPVCGKNFGTCTKGNVVVGENGSGVFSYVYGTLGLNTGYQ